MKVWKKFSAVALALMMVLALCAPAFAAASVDLNPGTATDQTSWKGEAGTFASADNITSQAKTLNLKKEITAYNLNESTVKAPTISYTYTIAPATVTSGTTVSDKTDKHSPARSVEVPVYPGPTGTSPTIASNGVVAWTTSETLNADTDGVANIKDIAIDFSNVVFSHNGVYRYVITEALTSDTYAASGVTETKTTDTTNNEVHKRYVDVYVRASTVTTANDALSVFNDGSTAKEWDIYGYTCFYKNQSITENETADANDKSTGAVKTIGFVAGTTDGSTALSADSYYTYNVTVSKVVENDNYAKSHAFPFTVIFSNSAITKNVAIKTVTSKVTSTDAHDADATGFVGTTSGTDTVISGTFSETPANNNFAGVLNIKHNTAVKYIGVPCGTTVDVYETNDLDGTTYLVETTVDNANTVTETDNSVTFTGTTPAVAAVQTMTDGAKTNAYESTKVTISTTVDADDDTDHSVAIVNTLLNISPTGVTLRYAPYLAMLGAGVVALPLTLRKKEELF